MDQSDKISLLRLIISIGLTSNIFNLILAITNHEASLVIANNYVLFNISYYLPMILSYLFLSMQEPQEPHREDVDESKNV